MQHSTEAGLAQWYVRSCAGAIRPAEMQRAVLCAVRRCDRGSGIWDQTQDAGRGPDFVAMRAGRKLQPTCDLPESMHG